MWIVICLLLVSGIFVGDLLIKNKIERTGEESVTKEIWGGRLLIGKHHNAGAALNFGQSRRLAVTVISVLMTAAVFVCLLLSFGKHGNRLLRIGLSLVLGGAFSNTYDRLHRKYVVDYVSFGVQWKRLRNIIFNISDFCIITGALLAALGAAR